MATFNVDSYNSLVSAINSANDSDEINFTTDQPIVLSAALPAITKNLLFKSAGNNATISGGGNFRVFTVNSGNVTFTNLTITQGRAKGDDGIRNDNTGAVAGNGGAGLGGGLLINGGSVTLINTNFQSNRAIGGSGGGSLNGTGGNGGDGRGGAIYVNSGSLRINNTSFIGNGAVAGTATDGGQAGKSQGGAIYVNAGSSVIAEGAPKYQSNAATEEVNTFANKAGTGAFQTYTKPFAQSINLASPNPTAQSSLDYTVTFSEDVTGVDPGDFSLAETGIITGEGVSSVKPINGRTYTVTINAGDGLNDNGTLQLVLNDDDSIKSTAQVPLGGTGAGNYSNAGQIYNIDRRPPTVSIVRKDNALGRTAADTVAYTVKFSELVKNVAVKNSAGEFKNFQVLTSGEITGAKVISVTSDANPKSYTVVVKTGTGNGTVGLRLLDDDSITTQSRDVPLGGKGIGNGTVDSPVEQLYTINKTPPTVSAIQPIGNSPTGDATVSYKVTFTQGVTGVTKDDFVPIASKISGASIVSVTLIDASNYTVVLNTGSGDGSLGLKLVDNDSIKNDLGVALGGNGANNGDYTASQTFTVIKSAPLVSSITLANPNPTAAGTVSYKVIFNQDVTGVDKSDFRLAGVGVAGFSILEASGSGKTYTVVANTGSGSGTLALNLADDDTIKNNVGAPLGGGGAGNGNFNGQSYTITKLPPRVTAINRLEASPTNAATVNFTVSFNEAVSRVDSSDFSLETQGLTGAGITTVTRVNDSFYAVAVSTGQGEGTVRLSLTDNDTIINGLGLTLGGAGVSNGSFRGESYIIDRTAPTVDIVDVAPDPRQDKVDAITISFNEAVKGLDLADLQLTQDGKTMVLDRATLTSSDGITWTLGNLRKFTNERGDYTLLLKPSGSGITDLAGNPLLTNASDRWTNLVTVEACDPGIVRRGTKAANRLQGTEDSDALIGLAGDDVLIGEDCSDRLDGGKDDDRLIGGLGSDLLIGGKGADRFIYSGSNQVSALENSLVAAPDRIRKFKFSQSDKFQLDFDDNLNSKSRPKGLFNAGRKTGTTLEQAAKSAYQDKNRSQKGAQKLKGNEAVFFGWRSGTYLAVNDQSQSFSASQDMVVNVTGIQLKSGDSSAGNLAISNYFV